MGKIVCFMLMLAFVSLLGTLPTELIPAQVPNASWANALIGIARLAGGRNLYSHPFFLAVLICFTLLLVGAILKQIVILISKKKWGEPTEVSPRHSFHCFASREEIEQKIFDVIKLQQFRLTDASSVSAPQTKSLHVMKNRHGAWGPLGMHIGFLIVLIGGMITFLYGDVREIEVREGGQILLRQEKVSLRLEKFSLLLYPGKEQVQQYISRFLVKDERGERRYEDLSVNHPLYIGSTKIFQMRYRFEVPQVELGVFKDGKPFEKIMLRKGHLELIPATPLSVSYEEVIPDFRMTSDGEVFSAGSAFRNPAVKLLLRDQTKGGGNEESIWAFQDLLIMHKSGHKPWDFSIGKIYKIFYSGVRISRDPGVPWVYLGFIILTVSSFLSSFAIPRMIRFTLQERHNGVDVCLAGVSTQDVLGLKEEIVQLADLIRK